MANLRRLKKDIDYLMEEVLTDCYLTMYLHPEKREKVVGIMQRAVDERNSFYGRVNNPPAKGGALARKHYGAIRRDMFTTVDGLFNDLSGLNK